MVYKTKKNRFKKIKDVQRKHTKKQKYYGGAEPVGAIQPPGNTIQPPGNAMMYNPAATYQFSGNNIVQPQGSNYQQHNSPILNDVGNSLNYVGSKAADINSGLYNFNKKTDDVKASVSKGASSATSWIYDGVKNIVSNIAESVDIDTVKQGSVAASIIIDAAEEPILEASKVASKVFEQFAANAGTTLINVATDAATAVPGVGAVMEIPKLANDVVYGIAKGVEAGTQLVNIAGNIVDATQHNVDKTIETLKKIEESGNYALQQGVTQMPMSMPMPMPMPGLGQPQLGTPQLGTPGLVTPGKIIGGGFKNLTKEKVQIGGRINDSISEFADPIGYQSILKGGNNNKTKKSFVKNGKSKSSRVHFYLEMFIFVYV
jgi:hypothetical protein